MTSELEEQFYKTFGIEPKNKCGKNLIYPNCLNPDKCGYDNCIYYQIEYPEITDKVLLELICIAYKTQGIELTIEDIKNEVLNNCIKYKDDIKQQIQSLFKEEE